MTPRMKLASESGDVHVSWAPDRKEKAGVAASVRGLSKRFKKSRVLEDVSFDVAEGESLVLLGASGSGKTTILRIMAGLEQPDSGRVILHGKDVTDLPARERGVGVIFQAYALFPRMTVEKNIAYGLKIRHRPRKERRETVDRLIKLVQLEAHRKKYPWQLSGGQQQRVAIARSLVNDPALILADEPTGNLDSRTSVEVMEIFQRLNRERGMTLILVTHEPDIAEYAGRVVTFKDGRIKSDVLVQSPRNAAEELKLLPAVEFDDEDEDDETKDEVGVPASRSSDRAVAARTSNVVGKVDGRSLEAGKLSQA